MYDVNVKQSRKWKEKSELKLTTANLIKKTINKKAVSTFVKNMKTAQYNRVDMKCLAHGQAD